MSSVSKQMLGKCTRFFIWRFFPLKTGQTAIRQLYSRTIHSNFSFYSFFTL